MKQNIRGFLSGFLALIMVINMLPLHVFAKGAVENQTLEPATKQETIPEDVYIIEEIVEKRSEYIKEFQLSNGLHLAAVYASPVHYEENGQWLEIDNTLQLSNTRSGNMYTNSAGVWQVSLPQSLTENNGVTITKGGYTLNFKLAGEMHDANIQGDASEDVELPAVPEEPVVADEATTPVSEETLSSPEASEPATFEDEADQSGGETEFPGESDATDSFAGPDEEATAAVETDVVPDENASLTGAFSATSDGIDTTENETCNSVEDGLASSVLSTTPVQDTANQENISSVPEDDKIVLTAPTKEVTAKVEAIALEEVIANAEYPEIVADKINSRLSYSNIYANTDVIFDLSSNQIKESVVLNQYKESLRGYTYALNVGDMTPVLLESGDIELLDSNGATVMFMPAPYLVDEAGETNYGVGVSLGGENGQYVLSYTLPQEWLADSQRAWPVVLDPIVFAECTTANIKDQAVYSNTYLSHTRGTMMCGYRSSYGKSRIYLMYTELPSMTAADVIVSASISLYKCANSASSCPVEVHKVPATWTSSTITWANQPVIDSTVVDYVICQNEGYYTWDITDIARGWYEGKNTGMMFKVDDASENGTTATWKQFYSSDYSAWMVPTMSIAFRNNNGLESYWDYTSSSAGRAGTGYVNHYTGNMVWVRNDIGFGGNRMPVSISHVYNANDNAENLFGMGYGWRTNFNQRVYHWNETYAYGDYYVWEDSDGTDHYFLYDSANTYKDEDGLELTLTTNGTGTEKYSIIDKYGNASYFDTYGRLTKQTNNQATKSNITITYTTTSGKLISTITDGAGRVYSFTYTNNLLSKIAYKGKGTSEITYVNFGYTNSNLTSVTDKDNKVSNYAYTTNNLMSSAQDIDGYKINYAYTTTTVGEPNRIKTITEYSGSTAGGVLNIAYAHNQTKFTDYNGNVQIVQFNNMGNTISIQDDQGRAQYAQYAINDPSSSEDTAAASAMTASTSTAKGNQLLLASKLQNTVGNVLKDSSFESSTLWTATSSAVTCVIDSTNKYMGGKSLKMVRSSAGTTAGVYSTAFSVASGETYTFSAYVKTGTGTAYLALHDGSTTVTSETLAANSDWTRLEVSYTNTSSAAKSVTARLMTKAAGTTYMDCAQVEKAPTASRYNLIENGDFTYSGYAWNTSTGRTTVTAANKAPAPQLDINVYQMTGNPQGTNRISQTVNVSGASGDTFVLAGWAKADSVPIRDTREFALIATFKKGSTTVNTSTVRFNYCADSTIEWQYAASPIVAKGAYDSIVIEIAYDYNANTAFFDGVQLYKEEFGNSYTYDEDGNIISVKDVQSQTTSYEYEDNDLTKQVLPSGAALTYTYDSYHNVKTATSDTGVVYNFEYDTYGNNTSVSIVSGSVKLTSSAAYTSDGNRLASTTDAAGKVTTYSYHENTNVLEWVKYPNDTDTTRTEYTYDNMYRLAKAEADVSTGSTLSAEYGYANDLLTSITTGSTTYSFTYGAFALRNNIKIGSRTLASYTYTDRNNYLESLDYGNGDRVDYTYDKQGRVTKQTYEDGDTVTYKYDNSGALASVTDSATGITSTYYYDYTDRLLRYAEKSGDLTHIVGYEYDSINNLTALVETINGIQHTTTYSYDDDNRVTSVTNGGASKNYTYDSFSRVNQKETKNGTDTILTDTLTYRSPTNTTTAGQVTSLRLAAAGYNVTYAYAYDDNGNILSISDGTNTTSYAYDSANQLIRENNQAAGKTWVWTYDDAGNILSRAEYAYTTGTPGTVVDAVSYTYGDTSWGDLLTAYDGVSITHDEIGNPLTDGTWTYTWEHGRELATMSDGSTTWTYTYNADGLRTKRTNGSTTYNYIYNGSSLSQMTVGTNLLIFSYDASGSPMSVTYNGVEYYYVTNIQGDVIAILDADGTPVVNYTYDAWGKLLTASGTMSNTLGVHNPLRYRGYVYDDETNLYYLQSRYYDPEIGRYLNSDDVANLGADDSLNSFNLFAYCTNNPVNRFDENGNWSMPNWAKVAIGVGIIAAAAAVTVATGGAAAGTLVAAVHCAAQGALVGAVTQGALGAVTGGISGAVMHRMTTGTWSGATNAAIDGAASGFMTGAITGAISGAISSPYCFVAGTTVLTATGAVAIETIQKGDRVWAWDEETGDVALKEVVETYVNETDELVHVFVNGEEIVTTPAHPFYSPVKGWTDAAHLRAGDILVLLNGEYVVVEKVQHEILETPVTVYNFQVEDYHTYYVSSGILVHNTCRGNAVKKAWKNEQELVRTTGQGTRNWTPAQMKELLNTGKVKGFVGHHMKSVKGFPNLAGDPNNIQFLTRAEHLLAHGGNWRNITYGRYIV